MELSFRNQLALLSYFRGGRESSQVTTNTREILFNGADGITLVNHADVVIMHETQIHFAASEHTFDSNILPFGEAVNLSMISLLRYSSL